MENNITTLRRQIVSSSPELRKLESQLRSCLNVKDNKAAIAEKHLHNKENEFREEYYAKLVKELSREETMGMSLDEQRNKVQKFQQQRELMDQIAEKKAKAAGIEAQKIIEAIEDKEGVKNISEETEKLKEKKAENQRLNSQQLDHQCKLKNLIKEEEHIIEKKKECESEEYNLLKRINEELQYQEKELSRLQWNQREKSMVTKLDQQIKTELHMKELRNDIEVLQHQYKLQEVYEKEQQQKLEAKKQIVSGYDQQLQEKRQLLDKEKRNDEIYRKMLMEVQAEEGKLYQLAVQARKRRQKDHQILTEKLLEERRFLRETLKLKQDEENQTFKNLDKLKQEIIEEEERKLLLDHAPHLLSYFTQEMFHKLNTK